MTPELTALAVAALVQFASLGVFGYFVRSQGNLGYQTGNRDTPPPHTGKAARAQDFLCKHAERLRSLAPQVTEAAAKQPPVSFRWIFDRSA